MKTLGFQSASVLTALLLFLACSGHQELLKNFDKTLQSYHGMIQFKQADQASKHIDPKLRAEFFPIIEKMMKNVNVSDFNIRSVTMNDDEDSATVVVIREIYDNSTFEVRSETITQEWKKTDRKTWYLVGGGY